ncbi:hypothetical protein FGO68_gene9128 [Halteria grandinella]|uniref:Uncharacterized protein n=1 Tax=Halteria grandinella TaxID=5974 RepID=A0A8J8NB98_HALGN|nr:hypothetical protein FGO68_gene9128 [Halteria grandinella]
MVFVSMQILSRSNLILFLQFIIISRKSKHLFQIEFSHSLTIYFKLLILQSYLKGKGIYFCQKEVLTHKNLLHSVVAYKIYQEQHIILQIKMQLIYFVNTPIKKYILPKSSNDFVRRIFWQEMSKDFKDKQPSLQQQQQQRLQH